MLSVHLMVPACRLCGLPYSLASAGTPNQSNPCCPTALAQLGPEEPQAAGAQDDDGVGSSLDPALAVPTRLFDDAPALGYWGHRLLGSFPGSSLGQVLLMPLALRSAQP